MTADTLKPTYVQLVADVASGTKDLVAAHAEQLGREVKGEADRVLAVSGLFSAAGTLAGLSVFCLLVAFAQWLRHSMGLTDAVAWGLTGLFGFVFTALFYYVAKFQLKSIQWIPHRSLQSFRESLSWITRR